MISVKICQNINLWWKLKLYCGKNHMMWHYTFSLLCHECGPTRLRDTKYHHVKRPSKMYFVFTRGYFLCWGPLWSFCVWQDYVLSLLWAHIIREVFLLDNIIMVYLIHLPGLVRKWDVLAVLMGGRLMVHLPQVQTDEWNKDQENMWLGLLASIVKSLLVTHWLVHVKYDDNIWFSKQGGFGEKIFISLWWPLLVCIN